MNNSSVTDGEAVIKTAIEAFGNVTILINNAGILRDKGYVQSSPALPFCQHIRPLRSFKNMSDQEWDQIMAVHLKGSYACAKAAWPHFQKQGFGRIVNTASAAGLYGNFGQANYSAAKMGLVGFTKALAAEGARYNIKSMVVAPVRFFWPTSLRSLRLVLNPLFLDGCFSYDRNHHASGDARKLEGE